MFLILRSIVGVSQQPLNALNPALQHLNKKRYTPLRVIEFKLLNSTNSTNSYHEEECISEGFYLKGKTLKVETSKTNSTGEVGQQPLYPRLPLRSQTVELTQLSNGVKGREINPI